MSEPIFKLFANCIPVQGARRCLLCDLQIGRMKLIPKDMYDILTKFKDRSVEHIKSAYQHDYDREIESYFTFLEEGEWGFWCENPEEFPDLDLRFEAPELITNAIIDVDRQSNHDFLDLIGQLEDLGCKYLQIRCYDFFPMNKVEAILEATDRSRLRGIELMLPYHPQLDEQTLTGCCRRYPRIWRLVVHGAPSSRVIHTSPRSKYMGVLVYHPEVIDSHEHCGVIDKMYFNANLTAFTEALHYNSCLNQKISVDTKGSIKNCPSTKKSFGNTAETSLREALLKEEFKVPWTITKDQVAICRDCEFRYVCSDCRAFLQEEDNLYSKPAKCDYDPYTATWGNHPPSSLAV